MSDIWQSDDIRGAIAAGWLVVGASIDRVSSLAGRRLGYLATAYPETWTARATLQHLGNAYFWYQEFGHFGVKTVSPALLAAMVTGQDGFCADQASTWQGWCQPVLNASGFVIVPPGPLTRACPHVQRDVVTALSGNRRVFVMADAVGALGVL
ncbi:hypothetical protein [Pseudooceanicola sp. MF1-13]|uniref:hypothetical protein n=1 Tax=Pseudooceanicola sp. MF1-13 TaxID=3379095 RepID=UPI003892A761